MQLFGGNMGAKAVVALPFALRRKLVNRYLTSVRMRVDEAVALAAETVPFYRRQYGGTRPRTLGEAPVVTEEMLRRTSPQHLLSVQMKEAPIFAVRSRNGAPGYFCATDLMTLGAAALLHPQAGELAASFRTSRMCLNALPYAGSLLGPCAERLVRFLGGCVLNVAGMPEEAVLAALVNEAPAAVLYDGDAFPRWLDGLHRTDGAAHRAVVDNLQFAIRMDLGGPLSPDAVRELEAAHRLNVVQVLTDGFSFALFSCACGEFHPPESLLVETLGANGEATPGEGRLVITDLCRRTMPLVRYDTGLTALMQPSACPHQGQTTSVFLQGT